ncbi:MAG: undecaprenyl-diphosphatase UppP [Campylobacterota bacterium]|nr:undecaprenyl-diphosphatase UppP [Campylobacterota bacterium]
MTIFDAVILGIVEGITEFLPVSSTAHLILVSQLLHVEQNSFMNSFNIIIQIAPIFSVMIIYRDRLIQNYELWKKLIISFIPTGAVGFLFHNQIEQFFHANSTIALMILTGMAFLLVEYFFKEKEHFVSDINQVSTKQAIYVGLFQVLALVPGVSRSGSTILGGVLVGLKRDVAMSFSFLLAIPTMGAASGYMLLKEYSTLSFEHSLLLAVGFIVSFIVGWIAIKSFLAIVSKYSFVPFGWYLVLAGLAFGLLNIQM